MTTAFEPVQLGHIWLFCYAIAPAAKIMNHIIPYSIKRVDMDYKHANWYSSN